MGYKNHKIDQKKRLRPCLVVRQSVLFLFYYNIINIVPQDSIMDGIFFGRNRNNLVALYPYSQALRKGSKSSAIYWIKEIVI